MEEIYWKDYFNTLGQAIDRLAEAINHPEIEQNQYIQDASIQRFEFVIELFWKVLKKVLAYEKLEAITPREVLSKSYQYRLINDEEIWLNMLSDRNLTSHVYKQEDAKRILKHIKTYLPVYQVTYKELKDKYKL
jgi:nucleotidyltransferase substrate binding protein (TIGR01987 family)